MTESNLPHDVDLPSRDDVKLLASYNEEVVRRVEHYEEYARKHQDDLGSDNPLEDPEGKDILDDIKDRLSKSRALLDRVEMKYVELEMSDRRVAPENKKADSEIASLCLEASDHIDKAEHDLKNSLPDLPKLRRQNKKDEYGG